MSQASSMNLGLSVLFEPPAGNDVLFDLVAVHGLNGDPFETWTHPKTGVMWLRDLLPTELPDTRIMTFGYASKFYNFTDNVELRHVAEKILCELVDFRRTEEELKRPLVFVCHSLGGIVVKKALLIRGSEEQVTVQDAVFGVVFLATPHSGTDVANTASVISKIFHACSPLKINLGFGVLGSLRKGSKVLCEIADDFVEKIPKLQIVSFFEMRMTGYGIFKRLVVERNSAILNVPNEARIGQYADHRTIARFESSNDHNFKSVLTRLQMFNEGIRKKVLQLTDHVRDRTNVDDTDREPLFDIPSENCVSFRGRVKLLEKMETYFSQSKSGQRLIYALTGLGGAGKTHSALEYAQRNRFKYKSGVVYFNATSNTTLIADFHRLHDLMGLADTSDKVALLKQWFAKPKNTDWLMIFDGADNLQSVLLNKYFPNCAWGHIIVTSRDQTAVGLVAPVGDAITPLEEDAAVEVLLGLAAIEKPSVEETEQATKIVQRLGCLPLAVEQAGAFIRRYGKTLADYCRIFDSKQYEILQVTPGISGHERTVATVWELSFRRLENDAIDSSNLLMLFSFLEASGIRESMLQRGCSAMRYWGSDGEVQNIPAEDIGLDPELVGLIKNEMRLDRAIEQLLASSLIQCTNTKGCGRVISVHPLVQYCASNRVPFKVRQKWQIQAILLVSHAFPFSSMVVNRSSAIGNHMMSHVQRVLDEFDQLEPSCDQYRLVRRAVCLLLFDTQRFHYKAWKHECVSRLKSILKDDDDPYLTGTASYIESRLFCMEKDPSASSKALEEYLGRSMFLGNDDKDLKVDERLNATRGNLILLFAENLLQQSQAEQAQVEIEGWKPLNKDAPSRMERIVTQNRDVMLGRILRDQGKFDEALSHLEKLFRSLPPKERQLLTFTNLAEIYCEVGRPQEAEAVLEPKLKQIQWQKFPTGRRLYAGLMESYVRRGMFNEAEEGMAKLISAIQSITAPDISKSNAYLKIWGLRARLSHLQGNWKDALAYWNYALKIVEDNGWETGFSHGIVLCSMAQVLARLGHVDESRATHERALKSLATEGRQYFMVGLGSYWYEYATATLGQEGPSPIITQSDKPTVDEDRLANSLFPPNAIKESKTPSLG